MTPDKTPTDEEILDAAEEFRSQYMHGGTTFDYFDALGFARAVLAKWGSPVVAGEPLTDSYVQMVPDKCDRIVWRNHYYHLPLTTPQPTQAQAGAQPDSPCSRNPFYHGPRNCTRGTVGCCEDHGANIQAQAGAVPLTDAQADSIAMAAFEKHCGRPHPWKGAQPWVIAAIKAAARLKEIAP